VRKKKSKMSLGVVISTVGAGTMSRKKARPHSSNDGRNHRHRPWLMLRWNRNGMNFFKQVKGRGAVDFDNLSGMVEAPIEDASYYYPTVVLTPHKRISNVRQRVWSHHSQSQYDRVCESGSYK
jgi:hypothetical protein